MYIQGDAWECGGLAGLYGRAVNYARQADTMANHTLDKLAMYTIAFLGSHTHQYQDVFMAATETTYERTCLQLQTFQSSLLTPNFPPDDPFKVLSSCFNSS